MSCITIAVEDNATVMIEYAGGVRGIVDVRWHSKVARDECRIRGTDGEMELSPLNGPDLIYPGARENLPPHANLHYPMLENFVDAVEGKAPLLASGASSFWTDWVTERARRTPRSAGILPAVARTARPRQSGERRRCSTATSVPRPAHFAYSFFTTSPPFITNFTRSSVVTSLTGSPSTATMSAHAPGSSVPTLPDHPSRSAAFTVAA